MYILRIFYKKWRGKMKNNGEDYKKLDYYVNLVESDYKKFEKSAFLLFLQLQNQKAQKSDFVFYMLPLVNFFQ